MAVSFLLEGRTGWWRDAWAEVGKGEQQKAGGVLVPKEGEQNVEHLLPHLFFTFSALVAFGRLPALGCRDVWPCLIENQLQALAFLEQCVWWLSSPCLSGLSCCSHLQDMFFNVLLYGWIPLLPCPEGIPVGLILPFLLSRYTRCQFEAHAADPAKGGSLCHGAHGIRTSLPWGCPLPAHHQQIKFPEAQAIGTALRADGVAVMGRGSAGFFQRSGISPSQNPSSKVRPLPPGP